MVSDLMVVFDCLDGLQMRGSIRWQELHVLAEFRKQEYGYYNINLLGSRLAPVIRNFAPPKFRKVKPPTKNTINKECKCGKNREAFINFVVETKK